MLSVIYAECHIQALYAECRYAQCRYAECRYAECRYAECCYAGCHSAIAWCDSALTPFWPLLPLVMSYQGTVNDGKGSVQLTSSLR